MRLNQCLPVTRFAGDMATECDAAWFGVVPIEEPAWDTEEGFAVLLLLLLLLLL